jgi:O-antigen ligase
VTFPQPQPVVSRGAVAAARPAPVLLDFMALCALAVGVLFAFDVEWVGRLFLGEVLVVAVAAIVLISGRSMPWFNASVFIVALGAGLATLAGYCIADAIVASTPQQYLRGWGRVILMIGNCAALVLLAGVHPRNLWLAIFGMGVGGIVHHALAGTPLAQWKLGYAEYATYVLVCAFSLLPRWMAISLTLAFGAMNILLDYRSVGAACILAAVIAALVRKDGTSRNRRLAVTLVAIGIGAAIIGYGLSATDTEFSKRREASNVGRYVGIRAAIDAIWDAPFFGYGSWARDPGYARAQFNELDNSRELGGNDFDLGTALLPHSQFLQAWVEGGLLGVIFFAIYGCWLARTLWWFAARRPYDGNTLPFLMVLLGAAWALIGSPFLWYTRITIGLAVGIIAIAGVERRRALATQPDQSATTALRRAGG